MSMVTAFSVRALDKQKNLSLIYKKDTPRTFSNKYTCAIMQEK